MAKEYIEREAAKRAIMSQYLSRANKTKYADVIDAVPAADVEPVRHGRWAHTGYDHGLKVCECSVCKKRAYGSTKFCPNCGAKMDKDGDEEKRDDND